MLGVVGGFLTRLCRQKQQDEEAALVNSHADPTCYQEDIYPWKKGRNRAARLTASCASLKPAEEILSACGPVSRGNATPADLISTQPLPAPPAEVTRETAVFSRPQSNFHKPTCARCGLTVPDHRLDRGSKSLGQLRSSGSSEHSGGSVNSSKRSKVSVAGAPQTAATPAGGFHDSCFHLLLACLWCQCSALLLGLLEACSTCVQGLCSSCCRACGRCCSAVQEAPVEELNCHAHCHSVLFESCCEPTECLEFCLECCEICHRS